MRIKYLFILLSLGFTSLTSAQNNVREVIEQMVKHDTDISMEKTPGFIIAAIDGDSTFIESFGQSLAHPDSTLSHTDIFEIGGLSKVLTSILFQNLLIKHNIDLNRSVDHHFDESIQDKIASHGWTYHSLLTHQTGLPKIPTGLGLKEVDSHSPYADYIADDLMDYLKTTQSKEKEFKYGHINYALIEYIIEDITGQSFNKILQNFITSELNLHHTSVYSDNNPTPGYTYAQKISSPQKFAFFGASLGIKSTLSDLIHVLRYLLKIEEKNTALSAILSERNNTGIDKKLYFTTGLYRMEKKRFYPIYLHSGRSNGHYAFFGVVPATKTGAIIMANSVEGTEDLGLLTLRMLNDTWKRKSNHNYE